MSLGAILEEAEIHGVKFVLQGDKTNPSKQPVAIQGEERLLQKDLEKKRKMEEEEAQDADKRQKITEDAEKSRQLLEESGIDQFTGYTGPHENVKCNHCKTPWHRHKASKTKDSNSIGSRRQCDGEIVVDFRSESMSPIFIRCPEWMCAFGHKKRTQYRCQLHSNPEDTEDTEMMPQGAILQVPGSTWCRKHGTHHKDGEVKWVGCVGEVKIRTMNGYATIPCPIWRCSCDKRNTIRWSCPEHNKKKVSTSTT